MSKEEPVARIAAIAAQAQDDEQRCRAIQARQELRHAVMNAQIAFAAEVYAQLIGAACYGALRDDG